MELKDIFFIVEKDWYKLQAWATIAHEKDKNEISGLMTAVPQEDGRFKVGDVEILKQENTASNTELDGDAVTAYTMKYGMKYNNPKMKFVWWHSHHTMEAFWSGTDTTEIDAWKNTSFSLALVINLREEYLFRVSFWRMNGLPLEQHIDTTLTIERNKPKVNITSAMSKQYKELCSSPQQVINKWQSGSQAINLWNQHQGTSNQTEVKYSELLEAVEHIQDEFVSGTISHKVFKKQSNALNVQCKNQKLPFRMKVFNENKQELLNLFMCKLPDELIDFDDNNIKNRLEQTSWQNKYGGVYGY